ncbi:cytochrome P450 [Streptomyces rubradiris]|uniref:cytochrome P450 n=1 Tax=Streptomyces rubradiris TaxID=285531 RepID=UPI0036F0666F
MSSVTDPETVLDQPLRPPHHRTVLPVGPPRHIVQPNGTPAWLVTKYHHVRQVLTDPRFSRAQLYSSDVAQPGNARSAVNDPDAIVNQDGTDHLRLRRIVQETFTPRAVARWRVWIAPLVDELLDDLEQAGPPADLIAPYVHALPSDVICRLMGLEGIIDREYLARVARYMLADETVPTQKVEQVRAEYSQLMADVIAERRERPGDDLVSDLVRAAERIGGIPEAQLVHLMCSLPTAAADSTASAIGNSLVYLLGERLDTWPRLGASLQEAELATERLIHHIPLGDGEFFTRYAVEDVALGGVTIPGGSTVAIARSSAGRDPEVYRTTPDEPFGDLFSPLEAPTLALGAGPHYCLGAPLVRLLMQLSLHRLAARLPGLRLTGPVEAIEWRLGSTTRSPRRLEVTW